MKNFKAFVLLFSMLFLSASTNANNLQITGISVNQATQMVSFTISWDNSWRVSSTPNNWDAVWVFVKFKDCGAASNTPFTHGTLSSVTSDHSYTNLEAMTSVNGVVTQSAAQGATMDFTDGIMLRRNSIGQGTVSSTVSLKVTNLPGTGSSISTSVFGLEMVYVPQGDFYVGDQSGANYYTFLATAVPTDPPMQITSAAESGAQNFYVNAPAGIPTTITSTSAAFPKGQYGFYMMKYEITQGLYAEFLNTLGSVAATARYPGNFGSNRNQLTLTGTIYSSTRPDRAQNWLSWADVSALLDWACLRPMTELEYEKSCRGNSGTSLTLEYAWGSTTISSGTTFAGAGVENGTEVLTTGNAIYTGVAFANGDGNTGPARAGIFATSSSTRQTAGASFYGIMDLTGNVREVVVAMVTPGANNTYTRTWGDGLVDPVTGNHNVGGGWPSGAVVVANAATTNLVGHKGGAWNNGIAQLTVSERLYIYSTPVISRQNYNGGRGVR
ncbi:MAG: SUMF1/EgtB/PvdO family nonheme iron enzyme [Bacteroidetes bacterium]|nr:SUMF1/EgtB/PvdO family nonheme iron enzyme [Bacteroidota bacterium]